MTILFVMVGRAGRWLRDDPARVTYGKRKKARRKSQVLAAKIRYGKIILFGILKNIEPTFCDVRKS